jgi:hypothetical protein
VKCECGGSAKRKSKAFSKLRDLPLTRKLKSTSKLTLFLLGESASFRDFLPAAERAVEAHKIARNEIIPFLIDRR